MPDSPPGSAPAQAAVVVTRMSMTIVSAWLQYVSGNFTTWRWLILIGCLAPAYWAAEGIARLFELAVEWRFFEDRRVLYYLIGTTVSGQ